MSKRRDRQLVRRVQRKSEDGFEHFFDSLFPRLYRFARTRLGGRVAEADIEDIVQETMLKAVRNLDAYRGEASLFTWACQICRHEIAAWHRREGRVVVTDGNMRESNDDTEPAEGTGADELERRSTEEAVQLALDRLPPEYAMVLEGKYVVGWTVSEVARHVGRSRIATQSLLARARRAFGRCYLEVQGSDQGERDE